jgi:ketosteroid isomerase-like protein
MRQILLISICIFLLSACTKSTNAVSSEDDNKAFAKLRKELARAFIDGDIKTIISYHHPEVIKSHSYNKLLVGRDANIADLKGTLQSFSMKFKEHKIESFVIHGNTATEISSFTIEGTPRGNGNPFIFKGRSMVLYIRYNESPAGWGLIREMIQTP